VENLMTSVASPALKQQPVESQFVASISSSATMVNVFQKLAFVIKPTTASMGQMKT
jgi:hypothetical protein